MASKILLKKSTTASSVPTTLDLDVGEVAINTEDKRLYTKDSGGSVVEVSTTPSTLAVTGNATVGGTLGVTGTTTAGTVNATNVTVSGTLTVPTPTSDTDAASKGYVDTEVSTAVANVIDASPAALDTLNELAAALGDDPNFSTTITTSIGTKLTKDGTDAMTGNLDVGNNSVINVADPTSAQHAATKAYVDTADATKLNLSGGTMTGNIVMGSNKVTSTATPTANDDLTRKAYVDSILGSATSAADSAAAAASSATDAETAQTAAEAAQTAAETAQTAAETAYDDFDDRYLGPKATAPALDNDGQALITGALYFDTTAGAMYVYDGSAWDQVALTPGDFLTVNNNLSDLSNTATAISNLGITATAAELNFVDGVTSNIQTQIDNIDVDPTKGTLTKSFANGETASITLSGAISPAPVVSVTKEVAQVGVSSKGGWDVATDGANYELHDTAYATTLTPGYAGFQAIGTWSYDSKSFSVASQEASVFDLRLNNDGTKLYILGIGNDTVYQYTLSTAYDISTASYDSINFSVASQETTPAGFTFNNAGTKMYIVGNGSTVYQYTLSTSFDVSTASYDSVSFSAASQESGSHRDIIFNPDGTKMYLTGDLNNTVYQYTLSTAFDVSTASYDSVSLNVGTQQSNPNGVSFNSDGTVLYVVGTNQDFVHQYNLTTGYDLSTASYASLSFTISEETNTTGIVFSPSGHKMYLVGSTNNTVYQYSTGSEALLLGSGSFASTDVGKRIVGNGGEAILTAADGSYSVVTAFTDSSTIASGSWSMYALDVDATNGITLSGLNNRYDMSIASYDSVSFSVTSQETSPTSMAFNTDGTKMYVVGISSDRVQQYSLATAFDVSTASYDSISFLVQSQETSPFGIAFNNDGTKMYIVGLNSARVDEYTLSTAFNISTASSSTNFSVNSQDTDPTEVGFNSDGTKMYVLGYSSDKLHQYSLSTAFAVNTASYDSVELGFPVTENVPTGFSFNSNGTKLYLIGHTGRTVYQHTLSTAYDISTATYDSVSFSVASEEASPGGIAFNNDGTKMYISGYGTGAVQQYTVGQISTPTSQYSPAVTSASGQIDSAFWTDINTMTVDETLNGGNAYYAVSTDNRTTWAVIDNTDGVRNIVRNNAGTWQYNDATTYSGTTWVNATTNDELSTLSEALEDGNAEVTVGFDVSNASYDSVSLDVLGQSSNARSVIFNDDGTKLFLASGTNDVIYEYNLSTAYDMSTATSSGNTLTVTQNNPDFTYSLLFNSDGTTLYVAFRTTANASIFNAYNLSTAYDLSTASYDSLALTVTTEVGSNPVGTVFNNDGTKLYILSSSNIDVYQYSLSTAYDVSTATYDSVSLDVSDSGNDSPLGLSFNSDGTKLFLVDNASDEIVQYSLSTAYDLSTASSVSVLFDVSNQAILPTDVVFNANGTKMYVLDITADKVFQYSTGSTSNYNRMNSTQLDAVTDPNHYTLGDTLDLAIMLYTASAGSIPESDGVSINYDAEALNQGAVLGTDYDYDFPDSTTVRVTSNAAQNLKIRVV